MKKTSVKFILLAFITSLSLKANAQTTVSKWAIGFHSALLEPSTAIGNDFYSFKFNKHSLGLGLSGNRYLSSSFGLGLYTTQGSPEQTSEKGTYSDELFLLNLRGHYKFNNGYLLKEDCHWGPYIAAGIGRAHININATTSSGAKINEGRSGLSYYAGAGVRYRLNENLSLTLESGMHILSEGEMDAYKDNKTAGASGSKDKILEHAIGLLITIGKINDADKDGVADNADLCPNTPSGVKVDAKGCPLDSDKDGIADYLDECPLIPGISSLKGCPDKDKDGVADKDDRCPDVAGLITLKGCPDGDGDGVTDQDDKCKDTKKGYKVDATGCPFDNDGDGVVNEEDLCPDLKGLASLNGCPDSDGDGIADKEDKCPTEKGIAANKGCPELPKEVVKQLNTLAENIFFESGSDKLTASSLPRLDEVATILKKFMASNLTIDGHTDNTGTAAMNMELSQKRCNSVKNYLISKGIDASRLIANGYGDTRPVADNKTSDGKAKNRRVELKMQY